VTVLFVTWAGGGNSTPVLGLATRLVSRGHRVKIASPDDMASRFEAVGIDYEVIGWGAGDVRALIEREAPGIVVVDFMMPSWMSQAEASGVAWVSLVHTLYDRVAAGILTVFTTLEAVNDERAALGLERLSDAADLLERANRVLVTAPRELDSAAIAPPNVVHVGTILEEPGPDAAWRPPWPHRPLIVMSPGTTIGLNEEPLITCMLEAASDRDVHVIVNVGTHVDTARLRPPANAAITGYVRHSAVLPHADAVVTHGGLGSIVAALAHGLPLVCVPLGRDQFHNAERVVALGCGEAAGPDTTPQGLWRAVEAVLRERRYREAARPFAAAYDPTARAAIDELEALL